MTEVKPADGSAYIYVIDDVGLLQRVTPEYAKVALERGEIEPERDGVVRLIPQPINALSPDERRRQFLKKQSTRRVGSGRKNGNKRT